jgi:hypothetical protein
LNGQLNSQHGISYCWVGELNTLLLYYFCLFCQVFYKKLVTGLLY